MDKTTNSGSRFMKRVLFLEITGFVGLVFTGLIVYLILSLGIGELNILVAPALGMAIVAVFIALTIRYARRDIHIIHVLHAKPIYKYSRYLVYALAAAMVLYPLYLIFKHDDFFGSISAILLAELMLVLGVLTFYYNYTLSYLIANEHTHHHGIAFSDVFIVVLFPILLVGGSVFALLSESAETSTSGKPDFVLSSEKLIQEFQENDSLASAKYIGKKIQFSGRINEVAGDSAVLLKLNTGVEDVLANCGFDKSQFSEVKNLKPGDSVSVLCSCSGFTSPEGEMDLLSEQSMEFARCSLLTEKSNKK